MKENINTKYILGFLLVVAVTWAIIAQVSSNDQKLLIEKNQELEEYGYEIKIKSKIVFHGSEELSDADWRSFEVIDKSEEYFSHYDTFAKDRSNVYYGSTIVKNADLDSFEVLDGSYQKDNFKVYYDGVEIKEAISYSFETITSTSLYNSFAKDHVNVYNEGQILQGVSPQDFKIIDNEHYVDENNVYYSGGYYSDPSIIVGANPKTFSNLDGSYYKDDKNVYYEGKILSLANKDSFQSLDGYYGSSYVKDDLNVWYNGIRISNADAATFEIVDSYGSYAKDKNKVYKYGQVIQGQSPLTFDPSTYDPWS